MQCTPPWSEWMPQNSLQVLQLLDYICLGGTRALVSFLLYHEVVEQIRISQYLARHLDQSSIELENHLKVYTAHPCGTIQCREESAQGDEIEVFNGIQFACAEYQRRKRTCRSVSNVEECSTVRASRVQQLACTHLNV